MIVARTDAAADHGLDEAIQRGFLYAEAGADMLFFEMGDQHDDNRAMAERFRGRIPLHYNHSPSPLVKRLHVSEIEAMGFKTVCFYVQALMAACKTMREVLTEIRRSGNSLTVAERMVGFDEFWDICDIKQIREMEKKYGV